MLTLQSGRSIGIYKHQIMQVLRNIFLKHILISNCTLAAQSGEARQNDNYSADSIWYSIIFLYDLVLYMAEVTATNFSLKLQKQFFSWTSLLELACLQIFHLSRHMEAIPNTSHLFSLVWNAMVSWIWLSKVKLILLWNVKQSDIKKTLWVPFDKINIMVDLSRVVMPSKIAMLSARPPISGDW